jgi:hypothetical protein
VSDAGQVVEHAPFDASWWESGAHALVRCLTQLRRKSRHVDVAIASRVGSVVELMRWHGASSVPPCRLRTRQQLVRSSLPPPRDCILVVCRSSATSDDLLDVMFRSRSTRRDRSRSRSHGITSDSVMAATASTAIATATANAAVAAAATSAAATRVPWDIRRAQTESREALVSGGLCGEQLRRLAHEARPTANRSVLARRRRGHCRGGGGIAGGTAGGTAEDGGACRGRGTSRVQWRRGGGGGCGGGGHGARGGGWD